jgi:hypothetical protein
MTGTTGVEGPAKSKNKTDGPPVHLLNLKFATSPTAWQLLFFSAGESPGAAPSPKHFYKKVHVENFSQKIAKAKAVNASFSSISVCFVAFLGVTQWGWVMVIFYSLRRETPKSTTKKIEEKWCCIFRQFFW